MTGYLVVFVVLLAITVFLSVYKNKLTPVGGITAAFIGIAIFLGAGFTGIALIGAFFAGGIAVTSRGRVVKEKLGAADTNKKGRTGGQVIANGGVAAGMSLLAWWFPVQKELCWIMMTAAIAAATADTVSSELGTLYGRRFFNIITFKPDRRGENGVVSLEGLWLGLLGSIMILLIYVAFTRSTTAIVPVITGGTVGNLVDSVLGATLERKRRLSNDAVNFLNTLAAAVAAMIVFLL